VQTEECTHEKHKLRFATTQKTQSLPTNTEVSEIRKLAFLPIVKTPSPAFVTIIEFFVWYSHYSKLKRRLQVKTEFYFKTLQRKNGRVNVR